MPDYSNGYWGKPRDANLMTQMHKDSDLMAGGRSSRWWTQCDQLPQSPVTEASSNCEASQTFFLLVTFAKCLVAARRQVTDPKGGSPFDTMAVTLRHALTHLCKLTGDWRLVKVPGSRMEHESSNTELLFLLERSKISLLGELQGSLSAVGDPLSSPVEILLSLSIPSAKRFESIPLKRSDFTVKGLLLRFWTFIQVSTFSSLKHEPTVLRERLLLRQPIAAEIPAHWGVADGRFWMTDGRHASIEPDYILRFWKVIHVGGNVIQTMSSSVPHRCRPGN
ncbi:hypothetical protein U0070_027354 [Myodes glareolus]|uniref:Uncharacterized protein n=1 Tax=Myodes glareolus TaxID=447135 RepID=A0AAW0I207_MYOGA